MSLDDVEQPVSRIARASGTAYRAAWDLVGSTGGPARRSVSRVAAKFPFFAVTAVLCITYPFTGYGFLMAPMIYTAVVGYSCQRRSGDFLWEWPHPFATGYWIVWPIVLSVLGGVLGHHPIASGLSVLLMCGMYVARKIPAAPPPPVPVEPELPVYIADGVDWRDWPEDRYMPYVRGWHEACVQVGLVEKIERAKPVMTPAEARRYVEDRDYKEYIDNKNKMEALTGGGGAKFDYESAPLEEVILTLQGPILVAKLMDGWTVSDYAKKADVLADQFKVEEVKVKRGAPGWVNLTLVTDDPLEAVGSPVEPESLREPVSVTEPWVVGKDEEGQPVTLDIAAGAHLLIAGATRSGKSVATYSYISHVLRMGRSARLLVADPNDTTIAPFEDLVTWSTNSVEAEPVTAMLRWVRWEMARRTPILRAMRQDKIEPHQFSPELPLIVIVIDEAASYMKAAGARDLKPELLAVVAQGAKYGIRLTLVTQRPDSTILDTNIRAQFSARISFRVEDKQTAQMVFPDLEDPSALLQLPTGVGYIRQVGKDAKRFRGHYLKEHWDVADVLRPLAKPKVDVTGTGLEVEPPPPPPPPPPPKRVVVPSPAEEVYNLWDKQTTSRVAHQAPGAAVPRGNAGGQVGADVDTELLQQLLDGYPCEPNAENPAAEVLSNSDESFPSEQQPRQERLSDLVANGELTQGTLDHLGDITLAELALLTPQDVRGLPGHGPAKQRRISKALEARGLSLRKER